MHLSRRHRRISVVAVTALGLAAGASAMALGNPGPSQPSATQQPAALSAGDKQPVIVILKNQHPELSAKTAKAARKATADREQAPLVGQAQATGSQDIKKFSVINGFSATMTPAEADHLRQDPNVAAVVVDRQRAVSKLTAQQREVLKEAAQKAAAGETLTAGADGQTPPDKVLNNVCPTDPAKPRLEPEALQTTRTAFENPATPQAQNLVDGKGVKVGWIADGIDVKNPDFVRADGTPVFSDYQDFSGTDPNGPQTGGEAFGDASSIAAQGRVVYDLSKDVDAGHPLPKGCTITVRGVAPGASLVGLNVFGTNEFVFNSTIVEAIDYAVNVAGVDVLNESLGGTGTPAEGVDPVSLADDAAVAAGVTVVASTGDAGVTHEIEQPAVDPNVISVGATTAFRDQAAAGTGGARNFATSWNDDNTATLSSAGTDVKGRVLDLVAPGQGGWAVCTADPRFSSCTAQDGVTPSPIYDFGGTSQSAPLTAGGAALVIEAYKNTHNGVRPTPALVKKILTSTARDLGLPSDQQGAGELDTYRAVRLAMSVKDADGSPAPQGDGLLTTVGTGDTQIALTGNGGSTQTSTVTVTNPGPNAQVVTAHSRELATTVADVKGTKAVDFTDPSLPFFYEGYGIKGTVPKRRWVSQTFTVPAGADHLTGVVTWAGAASPSLFRLVLVGPNGEFENWSSPQGGTHYSRVDQAHPAAGTWTAYFYANGGPTAFKGDLVYDFTATKYRDVGSVSPAHVTIAPGATQKFTVKETLPSDPGDASAAVEFDTASHEVSTVPVTLRTLISTNNDGGAFSGTFTGGNARAGSPAQSESFFFDVPKGKKNLDVDLAIAGNPVGHAVTMYLESPDHQIASVSTNQVVDANGNVVALNPTLQGYVDAPAAGRWVLFLSDANPVAGGDLGDKFTGHVKYNLAAVSAAGLPKGKLAAGTPVTVTLTVKNTGVAAQQFFADPRLTSATDYNLPPLPPTTATVTMPMNPSNAVLPTFLIPTHTTGLTAAQSSTVPADLEVSSTASLPDLYGPARGLTATATLSSPWISQGQVQAIPTLVGPINAAVTGSATEAMSVHTLAFDRSAVAATGDFWLAGVDASAPALNAVTIQPGQTGTITVVVTPTGAGGTKVSGVIYVDTFAAAVGSGDEVVGIPYSYTVK